MTVLYIVIFCILGQQVECVQSGDLLPSQEERCEALYQLQCGACTVRLEKVCLIEMEERLVQSEVYQCRNITNPACDNGLRTKCVVRSGEDQAGSLLSI